MEVIGYTRIKKTANLKYAMPNGKWLNETVRVFEFNDNSKSVLCIASDGVSMGMFDYSEVYGSFKCQDKSGILIPYQKEKNIVIDSIEYNKRMNRKGGYNNLIKNMVIENSIRVGEFNDNFLFQKQ